MEMAIWLVLFVIMVAFEAATLQLVSIWFAIGCLGGFFAALFGASVQVQIVLFLVISFLLLIAVKPLVGKYLKPKLTKTNAESLVGRRAKVTSLIDNVNGYGTVVVNGMEWTAVSADDAQVLEPETMVVIREIKGVKLIVEKED
ncbi:NfeD family protein [Cuneatibacter caecimuris]|uniref:Membrane protein implicated in regulation of membrane protease activity n=1 Tax=Cuneatibacter caecimuris TaxID=1796618 RepID=A0A4Q7NZT0_9FIRM|nr:NfeD family protein [Cuneatibacter caecimuris]RZS92767.1 membrane protein implicated in regulation of membrane protease activity [Cuneatibacter caecimuris]